MLGLIFCMCFGFMSSIFYRIDNIIQRSLYSWVDMRVRVEMDGLHFRIVFGVNSSLVSVAISGLAGITVYTAA